MEQKEYWDSVSEEKEVYYTISDRGFWSVRKKDRCDCGHRLWLWTYAE